MLVVFGLRRARRPLPDLPGGLADPGGGLLSIAAAIAYTAGPLPFGYYGLGDLGTFVFFGLVAVVGTYYVQAHAVTPAVWLGAVAMGCLVTAILVVNNIRDADSRPPGRQADAGRVAGPPRRAHRVCAAAGRSPTPSRSFSGSASACALGACCRCSRCRWPSEQARAVFTVLGPALNRTLAGTAQLAVIYAVVFAVGIILT